MRLQNGLASTVPFSSKNTVTERRQSTHSVLMVAPSSFAFNEENADSNQFQHHGGISARTIRQTAQAEFDHAVDMLRNAGVAVTVCVDDSEPPKPDAVFPNNWFTTWPDGSLYLYPMAAPNRRLERKSGVVAELRRRFVVNEVTDISKPEQRGSFLEGTGAMVFDHLHKVVYACVSVRCDEVLVRRHARALGYEPVVFHAYGSNRLPIYHTNVMMSLHTTTAVVCLEAMTDLEERRIVEESLKQTGRHIIAISVSQLTAFCGNTLELQSSNGQRLLVMSQTAAKAFTTQQRDQLLKDKAPLIIDIPTIENVGGGGIRCMLAEIFLPKKVV